MAASLNRWHDAADINGKVPVMRAKGHLFWYDPLYDHPSNRPYPHHLFPINSLAAANLYL